MDLSCGTGNYALTLAQRGLGVVGVDLSEPMLRLALEKAGRAGVELALVRADGSALPFRMGAFDLVTAILGLEFIQDPGKTVEEVSRVLKPGARLVVAILNRTGLWTVWRRLKRLFVRSAWRHATFLSPRDLARLLDERGFRELRWREAVHFLPIFRGHWVRYLARWERAGSRRMPGRATFVAVAARRV
ncbi:MAG: class I SAM-dependent methyltransferase [Candidatus Rokubacteria bacterium]|nr:class I SAM-dependent methyltransferase [Candidatus Rokubacteria bacterium]